MRSRAERWLRLSRQDIAAMPAKDVQDLIHELQVHQVELQMQNEELRQAQAELEASRDKYWKLYDFAPVGYLTLDEKSTIVEANFTAARQLNVMHEDLVGKRFSQFIASGSQDEFHLHNRKVLSSKEPQICELELVRDSRTKLCVQLHSMAVAGAPGHYRTALTDLTTRKHLEATLIKTRDEAQAASQAKSQFLANMSHEIRTPLNAIIGIGHILRQGELTTKQREQLDVLQSSATSLLHLINELLDIARIEACGIELERISFDFSELLSNVLGMLSLKAHEKGLDLIEDNQLKQTVYWGDALRIRQVMTNLVSNAIKFTLSGEVAVRIASLSEEGEIANIVLSVSDTGIGIPKEKQGYIFDVFTQADASMTRHYGGSGLGLAICKQLVEHMGGSISVTSIEGIGSTFTVQLPLQISQELSSDPFKAPPQALPQAPRPTDSNKPRILVVEDHAANVLIATTFLESFDYAYDVVADGRQAVQLARNHPYELILMDVQMQDMDGFEATRQIRQFEQERNRPPTPIVAMTAHALTGDKEKCLKAGMNDYISKPFNPEELRRKLEELLWVKAA